MNKTTSLVAVLLSAPAACAHGPTIPRGGGPAAPPPPPAVVAVATAGVSDPGLRDLLARHWDWSMRESPVFATRLGDHRFDDQIEDNSWDHLLVVRAAEEAFLGEARAVPAARLLASDRTNLELFIEGLASDLGTFDCEFQLWNVNVHGENPITRWNSLPDDHAVTSVADGKNLLARYRKLPAHIDRSIANLRRGLAAGKTGEAESVRRVLKMVDGQLAEPLAEWSLLRPLAAEHADWPEADRAAFRRDLREAVEHGVKDSLVRFRDLLEKEILPAARPEAKAGIGALPGGDRCYAAMIRAQTSLDLKPEDLHQRGLAEIERIDGEMAKLGQRLFGTPELAAILKHLRGDPALFFSSEEEVEGKAQKALSAAKAKIVNYFGILPKTDCVVHRVPGYEAPFTTIAYYREPHPDGSKPGEYMINVYQPKTRPRAEAEVLAYHEAIPGHHLQIAIAQELPEMPAFRRYLGTTAFVEGWALYTEQLADEMGLYSGDLDRLGMYDYDAWRASRLVVDTGIHAKGWSRAQAVQYMLEHTALAPNNIDNEVDRYIGWPGQALAYKVGQQKIWALRHRAEKALGAKFDLKGFHDAVLSGGAVTLPVLEAQVDAWIAKRAGDGDK